MRSCGGMRSLALRQSARLCCSIVAFQRCLQRLLDPSFTLVARDGRRCVEAWSWTDLRLRSGSGYVWCGALTCLKKSFQVLQPGFFQIVFEPRSHALYLACKVHVIDNFSFLQELRRVIETIGVHMAHAIQCFLTFPLRRISKHATISAYRSKSSHIGAWKRSSKPVSMIGQVTAYTASMHLYLATRKPGMRVRTRALEMHVGFKKCFVGILSTKAHNKKISSRAGSSKQRASVRAPERSMRTTRSLALDPLICVWQHVVSSTFRTWQCLATERLQGEAHVQHEIVGVDVGK